MERTALHLPLGDRTATNLVDRWLEAYGIRSIVARDAYEVCAVLLRENSPRCDMVFIGMDWLERNEQKIFEYVMQSWPHAVIVAYGDGVNELPEDVRDAMIRVPTNQALFTLLMESPDTLVPRMENCRSTPAPDARFLRRRDSDLCASVSEHQHESVASAAVAIPQAVGRARSRLLPREWTQLLEENES
ncbi:MAG: hypothetical protein AB7N71_05665 [Phycisphaerae bacterium]